MQLNGWFLKKFLKVEGGGGHIQLYINKLET